MVCVCTQICKSNKPVYLKTCPGSLIVRTCELRKHQIAVPFTRAGRRSWRSQRPWGSPHILLEEIRVVSVLWESNLEAYIKLYLWLFFHVMPPPHHLAVIPYTTMLAAWGRERENIIVKKAKNIMWEIFVWIKSASWTDTLNSRNLYRSNETTMRL